MFFLIINVIFICGSVGQRRESLRGIKPLTSRLPLGCSATELQGTRSELAHMLGSSFKLSALGFNS